MSKTALVANIGAPTVFRRILFRSVFGSRREKNYVDEKVARKGLFYEDNFSLPDSHEPIRRSRVGTGQ